METNNEIFLRLLTKLGTLVVGDEKPKTTKFCEYDTKLKMIWCENIDKSLITELYAMVYYFVIDGIVFKIGRSSCQGGVKSMIDFYLNAGFDSTGQNRFIVNKLIREKLQEGCNVELYMTYEGPTKAEWTDPTGKKIIYDHLPDDQMMERRMLEIYKEMYDSYPQWNFQEAGQQIPKNITELHNNYKSKRNY